VDAKYQQQKTPVNDSQSILLIEDDLTLAAQLKKRLTAARYHVIHQADGQQGLQQAITDSFDIMIIDRMLPNVNGLMIVKAMREQQITTPVLLLSALAEVNHRIDGLRAGGDDYLTKPYFFDELLARVEALLRRNKPDQILGNTQSNELTLADLSLDLINHTVTRSGVPIRLQPKELRLLEYLLRHSKQLVTRSMLLEQVWGIKFDPATSIIDTQISRLRKKIDKDFTLPLLHTIRGKGFMLTDA